MISVPLTAAIVALLAMVGISPTPWLVGGILIAVKIAVGLGLAGGVMKLFGAKKAAAEEATPTVPPSS